MGVQNETDEDQNHPDYKEDTPHNGLICWLDSTRECGADCMGYVEDPSESKALSRQQQNCVLLVSVERLGRYVGHLASTARDIHHGAANAAADQARSRQKPPPDPRGHRP